MAYNPLITIIFLNSSCFDPCFCSSSSSFDYNESKYWYNNQSIDNNI